MNAPSTYRVKQGKGEVRNSRKEVIIDVKAEDSHDGIEVWLKDDEFIPFGDSKASVISLTDEQAGELAWTILKRLEERDSA